MNYIWVFRSGGTYRFPTGTVQILIYDNKAWTINPEETPIYLALALQSSPDLMENQSDYIQEIQKKSMENVTKIMSPYTTTTGKKEKAILKEIISGKIIKYRTVGLNQAASTTGEVIIDDSFTQSLKEIGIDPNNI